MGSQFRAGYRVRGGELKGLGLGLPNWGEG